MKDLLFLAIILSACIHTLSACSNGHKRYNFPENILSEATHIEGDTVFRFSKPVISAYWRDGKIITVDRSGEKIINVIDSRTGDTTLRALEYGADGDKIIAVFPRVYNDTLVFADHLKQRIVFLNMDSLVTNSQYCPDAEKLTMDKAAPCPTVIPYCRDRLLGINPYCFRTDDGSIDNQDNRRFILSDSCYKFPEFDIHTYYTLNVAQGTVLANPGLDRLVYLHDNNDIMEIYEFSSLKKLIEITGPVNIQNTYSSSDGMIFISGHAVYTYLCAAVHDNWFITAFNTGDGVYLLQTDWNGHLLKSYYVGKETPYCLSLSENGEHLYSLQYTPDNHQIFVRYTL